MDHKQLKQICEQAIPAVRSAAAFIKAELGKVHRDLIQEKERHSLVSYVDIETEKMLVRDLGVLLPGCRFITEEGTTQSDQETEYTWVIDPLDGTTNFLKGIPVFSISVALAQKGHPILGIIHDIMQDACYVAWENGGAYRNGEPIRVSEVNQLEESVVATGFPYKRNWMPNLSNLLTQVLHHSRGVRRLGSAAIDLAYTADGKFDAYYETRLNAWDIAAGIILIREAGGKVTDFYGKEDHILQAHHVLASNGKVHQELFALVQKADLDN